MICNSHHSSPERLGRTADAIEAYTAAAALAPEDPVALVNRGDALVRAGRLDDATRAYVAAPSRVELKSSTRLRCDRMRPFRRTLFGAP